MFFEIQMSSFKEMHLKTSSAKWRSFCLGLNVMKHMWVVLRWVFYSVGSYQSYLYPLGFFHWHWRNNTIVHYCDVIMGTLASQITSLTIVLLNRSFRCRSQKISKLRVTCLCAGNSPVTGEFPAQMASDAENVSIWWRHHTQCHRSNPEGHG